MTMIMPRKSKSAAIQPRCLLALLVGCLISGCAEDKSNQSDLDLPGLRAQLISEAALEGEQMVSDVRKQLREADVDELPNVVVKGRIDAGKEMSPWEDGKAAFVLTDATGHEGEDDHDVHACPFCSRKINDYLVMVSFFDDDGNLYEADSRELFQVQEKQLLQIKGTARIDPDDDLLYLKADQLHRVVAKAEPAAKTEPEAKTEADPEGDDSTSTPQTTTEPDADKP